MTDVPFKEIPTRQSPFCICIAIGYRYVSKFYSMLRSAI